MEHTTDPISVDIVERKQRTDVRVVPFKRATWFVCGRRASDRHRGEQDSAGHGAHRHAAQRRSRVRHVSKWFDNVHSRDRATAACVRPCTGVFVHAGGSSSMHERCKHTQEHGIKYTQIGTELQAIRLLWHWLFQRTLHVPGSEVYASMWHCT